MLMNGKWVADWQPVQAKDEKGGLRTPHGGDCWEFGSRGRPAPRFRTLHRERLARHRMSGS